METGKREFTAINIKLFPYIDARQLAVLAMLAQRAL